MKRNQENGFESLVAAKFAPLAKKSMNLVLGGRTTPGGTKVLYTEYTVDGDTRLQRQHLKSWTADEITDAGECYTGLEHCTTDWVPS